MGKQNRSRIDKKKRRERRLRRARNLRRNEPRVRDDEGDDFDVDAALEALPMSTQLERMMRGVARVTGRRRFSNPEEVLAALAALDEGARTALRAENPREEAQDLVFLALDEANARFSLDLVEDALDLDPQNPEALAMLAVFDPQDEILQLRELEGAAAIAQRGLPAPTESEAPAGELWCDVLARPYMRTLRMLSNTLYSRGHHEKAMAMFHALLALDRSDPLRARESWIGSLLALGDAARAAEGIDQLAEDEAAFGAWARTLERWVAGDRAGATQALARARELNPVAEQRLLEPVGFDEAVDDQPTDPDRALEATGIGLVLGHAWGAHPEALAWLEAGGA